jgi:hypothetical protein
MRPLDRGNGTDRLEPGTPSDQMLRYLSTVEVAAYILDTFPIVREPDEKAFKRFLTKDLVLAYMNAVAEGDLETVVRL